MSRLGAVAPATVRSLHPADLEEVGHLVRESFEPSLRPYLVPAQPGWIRFLRLVLEQPTSFPTHRPAVVEAAGKVVAFADYRDLGADGGFLSYICVDEQVRGRGIARLLLHDLTSRYDHRHVALDVFDFNVSALALYHSMGFSETGRQTWWRDGLPPPSRPVALTNLPAAAASHEAYGFCEISGEVDGRGLRFGRMGDRVLRAYSRADFDDDTMTAALRATFPTMEECFAVLPDGERPASPTAQHVLTSLRMATSHQPSTERR